MMPESTLRISEIYASVQGEGLLTGTPSLFVRTSGCNLRCWFCDTDFASWNPEGEYLTIPEIIQQCHRHEVHHTVLTGGEPMIHGLLPELTNQLRQLGHHITIETAGTIYQPVQCDLMSISPKLANSTPTKHTARIASEPWQRNHEARRENLPVIEKLIREFDYQLKFVVDTPEDAQEVLNYVGRLSALASVNRDRVLLMPQGTEVEALQRQANWLIPWCQTHDVRYCQRAHIAWFGNRRGT